MEDDIFDDYSSDSDTAEEFGSSSIDDGLGTTLGGVSCGVGLDDNYFIPTFDELIDAGFSVATANNILDDSRAHCYTDEELAEVLKSDHPAEAYKEMMDEKAHDAIERADGLIDMIENSGLLGDSAIADENIHHESSMFNPSFLGNSITESRDRYASDLEDELSYKHIHIYGSYGFDSDHGGFDRATGQKIHDAIEKARGEERISDYTYRQLMDKLDDACYYQ